MLVIDKWLAVRPKQPKLTKTFRHIRNAQAPVHVINMVIAIYHYRVRSTPYKLRIVLTSG